MCVWSWGRPPAFFNKYLYTSAQDFSSEESPRVFSDIMHPWPTTKYISNKLNHWDQEKTLYNIKMCVKEIGVNVISWNDLASNSDHWKALVNVTLNRIALFLITWEISHLIPPFLFFFSFTFSVAFWRQSFIHLLFLGLYQSSSPFL